MKKALLLTCFRVDDNRLVAIVQNTVIQNNYKSGLGRDEYIELYNIPPMYYRKSVIYSTYSAKISIIMSNVIGRSNRHYCDISGG